MNDSNGVVVYRSQLQRDMDQALTHALEDGTLLPWLVAALAVLVVFGMLCRIGRIGRRR